MTSPEAWVALLALLLSQLPPIAQLLRGRRVLINTAEHFYLSHFIGNPNAYLSFRIVNAGGRNVSIRRILCVIKKQGGRGQWILPVQQFYRVEDPNLRLNFLGLTLKPDEYWEKTIVGMRDLEKDEGDRRSELLQRIRDDYDDKKRASPESTPELKNSLVDDAKEIFEKCFDLHAGHFRLYLAAFSNSGTPLSVCGFDFVIFPSHIKLLKEHCLLYKNALGLTQFNNNRQPHQYLKLTRIKDSQALKDFQALKL